jgi:serine/threonine-protein kinase
MSSRGTYAQGELVAGTIYRVRRLLAEGGMGTVYDVEDTSIGKRYVLKTLHSDLGNRADLARRMQAEARVLAKLNHPNVVEVVTAGVTADDARLPFFVMERLNGQNLRLVLQKKGALEVHHACRIAIDLLDALDHAHDRGIVHRDVKPENIFLHRTVAGVTITKLLDFGVMTLLGSETQTGGRFVGTLRYAAPEQIAGEPVTPKADLYAAGLVLYEMLTGKGPFDDRVDAKEIAAAHLHAVPRRPSELVNIVPEVDEIVVRALAKDPKQRPKDAFAFAAALRSLQTQRVPARVLTQQTTVAGILLEGSGAEAPAVAIEYAATERQGSGTQPIAQGSTLRLGEVCGAAPRVGVDRAAETVTRAPLEVANVPQVDTSILVAQIQRPALRPVPSSVSEPPAVTTAVPARGATARTTALFLSLFAALALLSFAGAWTLVDSRKDVPRGSANPLPLPMPIATKEGAPSAEPALSARADVVEPAASALPKPVAPKRVPARVRTKPEGTLMPPSGIGAN